MKLAVTAVATMSEEQLSPFLATLKADTALQAKLKGAANIDAALEIAKGAGLDVSKVDWLKYQAKQTLELSDEALERISGGGLGLACNCFTSPYTQCANTH